MSDEPQVQEPPIPINAIFGENYRPNPEFDMRQKLQDCDVILGVDVMSGHEFIVHGRDALERMAASDDPDEGLGLTLMRIAVDQETDELEALVALVTVLRGHHDYEPSAGT